MDRLPLPITFRYHLVAHLMRLMQAGESAAVVGMASVGKSNLTRCLQQADILEAHLGAEKEEILLVLLDSNDLTVMSEWNFLELLLYRLLVQAQQAPLPEEIPRRLEAWHEKLIQRSGDVVNAQRCVEQAVHWLCQVTDLKVVLLLDEFDPIYKQLSLRTWANLRALRDKNKYALAYLLFLRRELEDLRPVTPEVEAFVELFQTNILGLKPYDLPGTELMLQRMSLRQQVAWPVQDTLQVFDLSGGHGGLIRIIFGKVLPGLRTGQPAPWPDFFNEAEVKEECQKIWTSLTAEEKRWLSQFVKKTQSEVELAAGTTLHKLQRKGLVVTEAAPEPQLFSPLFATFVDQAASQAQPSFVFDARQQSCWIEGREISLPGLPAQLLDFLYQHRGQNCRRLDLLQHLYPEEDHRQLSAIPDFRLDAVVKSLREKIEPVPQNPRYVKTVRGVGFKLEIEA